MFFKHKTNETTIDTKSLTRLLFLTQLMLLSFPTQKNFNGTKDFICDVILQNEEREMCLQEFSNPAFFRLQECHVSIQNFEEGFSQQL